MTIDPTHPRAASLRIREQLAWGVEQGITSTAGLIAHGRGEAFDYLLGEKTHPFAHQAIEAAVAHLFLAKHPVLSVNGNTAALVADDMIRLAIAVNAGIEINLFHHSAQRVEKIEHYLRQRAEAIDPVAETRILSHLNAKTVTLPHIASNRKITLHDGIATADVVLVPLEDGDRAQALKEIGKTVITIDLNPLSRTARAATVTIVDNITRALPILIQTAERLKEASYEDWVNIITHYKNEKVRTMAIKIIRQQ